MRELLLKYSKAHPRPFFTRSFRESPTRQQRLYTRWCARTKDFRRKPFRWTESALYVDIYYLNRERERGGERIQQKICKKVLIDDLIPTARRIFWMGPRSRALVERQFSSLFSFLKTIHPRKIAERNRSLRISIYTYIYMRVIIFNFTQFLTIYRVFNNSPLTGEV